MAGDGRQALRMSTRRFDLVLSDLEMPVMSGYHLATKVKNIYPDSKIVIMTGRCRMSWPTGVSSGPVDAWLFKPFGVNELCSVLNSLELPFLELPRASRDYRVTFT